MSILNFCQMPPRQVQKEILTQVEARWDKVDVFLILAPVATGKSLLADTIAKWQKSKGSGTTIITPDNTLVRQYTDAHPSLYTVGLRSRYPTPAAYHLAKLKLRNECCVLNYYSYMANRPFGYNNTLIVDEAHHLIDHLRSTTRLWKHLYNIPEGIYSVSELLEWLTTALNSKLAGNKKAVLSKVKGILEGAPHRFVIEYDVEMYRGKEQEVIKIVDLIPRDNPPIYWPKSVRKIILMSATFSEEDLYDLGLDRRRVHVIQADSPIPHENRPIYWKPIADMSFKNMDKAAVVAADWAAKTAELRPGEKGLLHVTYAMSRKLQKHLADNPRFIFHTQWNKGAQLDKWLKSDVGEGKIFVGCGVTTGLSLDHDRARWQAIVNLPYANIRDRSVRSLLEHRPESYYWRTIRHVLQASGRVCRSPSDWGDTVILDSRFGKLYTEHKHLFPQWWIDSYQGRIS